MSATGEITVPLALIAAFGSSRTGLATVGYALYNADGTVYQARTTAGVAETAKPGAYRVLLGSGVFPAAFRGYVIWDTGQTPPLYAEPEDIFVSARIDAAVSSRLATSGYTAPATAAQIRDAILDEQAGNHGTAGTVGRLIQFLDVAISTRLPTSSYVLPDNADIAAVKAKTDNLPGDPADASDIAAAFTSVGSLITALGTPAQASALAAAAAAIAALGSPVQASDARLVHLDVDVSSRATHADVNVQVTADLTELTALVQEIDDATVALPRVRVPA